jgi:hypothetical protein
MTQTTLVKTIVRTTIAASIMISSLNSSAFAGEGFFEKIGDGPKRFVQDIFTPNSVDPPAPASAPAPAPVNKYTATLRVDCMDAQTGADRADNTITASSNVSTADARNYIINLANRSDLCQANGDTSRVTKPGSGRWM